MTTNRRRSLPRVPVHVALMLGASTAGYAVTLAGVAGNQATAEATSAAARAPAVDALAAATAANDRLARWYDIVRAQYAGVAAAYVGAGSDLDALREQLGELAAIVDEIDGQSRSLPVSVRLPVVRTSVPANRTPVSHATTGASGG